MMARIFFAASLLGAFAACGTDGGSVSTDMDDIEARGFESIIGDGGFDIYFMQAERTSVEVRGGDVSRVKARSDGKALRFYAEGGRHDGGDNVDIYVTSPVLRGITMNGTGDFESESPVRTDGAPFFRPAIPESGSFRQSNLHPAFRNDIINQGETTLDVRQR